MRLASNVMLKCIVDSMTPSHKATGFHDRFQILKVKSLLLPADVTTQLTLIVLMTCCTFSEAKRRRVK